MPATDHEEQTVCDLAETSLRHAHPGATVTVARAAGAELGVLDVRLEWPPDSPRPGRPPAHALTVRVDVAAAMARGAWREVATSIGEAVGSVLRPRRRKHSTPKREGPP